MTVLREQLEADVLIVGAGPAGLSCALHLANLIKKHNDSGAKPPLSAENIYVLEKGREIGAHQLSGAIMNPKALAELVPGFEKSAPLDTPVTDSAALLFTKGSSFRFPITPPPFQNKGNYVISLNKLTKWLGGLVEAAGVNVFKEFGGAQLIYEGDGIAGVITEDKGLDKNGKPKDNYTPGYELRAKVTVLAEGPRGSLTKNIVATKKLDNINPQIYSLGIKELWDVQPGKIAPGYVAHTLGWPSRRTCTAAAGFTVSPTIASPSAWSSASNTPIPNSIPTPRFKPGKRIPSSKIFSKAASWFATAQNLSPQAAGIPCPAITSTAPSSSAIPEASSTRSA